MGCATWANCCSSALQGTYRFMLYRVVHFSHSVYAQYKSALRLSNTPKGRNGKHDDEMCGLMRGNPGWLQNDSFFPAENVFVFPFPCYLFPSSSHLPGRQLMLTNPQYCRYEQLTRTHGPEQAAKMRQEKHAVVPAAGPTSEPAEAATEPQRTATAVRSRQYTAPAGDKVSDERQR